MTTEHKILTLIDRGVDCEALLVAIFDNSQDIRDAILGEFWRNQITEYSPGHLSLTAKGLDRLNELDDESS